MMHFIGLDAHSKSCTGLIMNSKGETVSQATFETTEKNLIDFVQGVKSPKKLAFEEQNLAHWLYALLDEHVDELVVAHAPHLPKQRGAKNDLNDARRLAEELLRNKITPVFHDKSKIFELRNIVYSYLDFTQDIVRTKNRYKSLLRSRKIPTNGSSIYTDSELLKLLDSDSYRFTGVNLFEQIRTQQEIKDSYEGKFEKLAAKWPVIKNLCSIPGIGPIRAATIAAIICSANRFENKHKLWAYAKLVKYIDVSDGITYGKRDPKGNSQLKDVFMGAATSNLMSSSSLRRYYDKLRTKGVSDRNAKKAVARRIAAIALMIMKTGKKYDDKFEEKRSRKNLMKT